MSYGETEQTPYLTSRCSIESVPKHELSDWSAHRANALLPVSAVSPSSAGTKANVEAIYALTQIPEKQTRGDCAHAAGVQAT